MKQGIEHIFFDLDRTLWDFERNSTETLKELFDEFALNQEGIHSADDFISTYICKNDHCWELYRQNQISKAELRTLRFRLALEAFGATNHDLALKIGEAYVERSPYKTALFPNTIETLDYLSRKYTLHIITNGFEEVQHIKMKCSGLANYFKHITTSEMAGYKKPDERIFKHALNTANANICNSLMIGDDLEVDVMGAINIGMKAIHFQPSTQPINKKVPVIQDLIELQQLL